MNINPVMSVALLGLAALSGTAGAVVLATLGTYDSAVSSSNQVDRNASGNSLSSSLGNDVAGFTADVSTAYNKNFGGVITFVEGTVGNLTTALEPSYGVDAQKSLSITVNTPYNIQGPLNLSPISGDNSFFNSTSTVNNYTMTFGAITATTGNPAPDPLEAVVRVGFTLIGRRSGFATTPVITAYFSNDTTALYDSSSFTSPGTGVLVPAEDTFYGFTAPAGAKITSIYFNFGSGTTDRRRAIDDFGFITAVIPEPSSSALMAAGAALLFVRRRL